MKEQTLIEMQNKVNTLGSVLNRVIQELEQLRTLSVGNMEVTKLLPGYEDALNALKEKAAEAAEQKEEGGLEGLDE